MPSPLEFNNTEKFRKALMARNLPPYPKSPIKAAEPINYETILRDLPVIDSPDKYIDQIIFANELYVLNQYGKVGGYDFTSEFTLKNSKSNEGEYGFDKANLLESSKNSFLENKKVNYFSDSTKYLDSAEYISSLDILHSNKLDGANGQPYPNFVYSMYSPVSILLSENPQGSDGPSTKDSFLMQLAIKNLKKEFEERVARQIEKETISKINLLKINDGLDLYNILSGNSPLINPDWRITQPANPITASADLALRLGGSIIPFSPIPGSYFDSDISLNRTKGLGNNVRKLLTGNNTGSELFFNNTGEGQKAALFFNLKANRYRPNLDSKFYERIFGDNEDDTINGISYYVGSPSTDPKYVSSPSGDLPLDSFGDEISAPVYGPDKLGKVYEGEDKNFKFGLSGKNNENGGSIEGGFSWVSSKYKDNAGKNVGVGGNTFGTDSSFNQSTFNSTESTNNQYTSGSILDDIQRLVNSQPNGAKRLEHVGNAIDQVSKVFNDGYREITKGSKVLRYEGAIGNEVGMEYCRLFTKDTPYKNYSDLQKTDGITNSGRRIKYSVLDNAYNLNIYPVKPEGGQDSTNLIVNQKSKNVKKYMLSLENLAWRTSNTPGFSVSDLPVCERGPNGGRIMWFPPYDLKFSEDSSSQFNETNFIGRVEPVYSYKSTSRSGSLSFKMIVDHPSILNVIVDKVLANENDKDRINGLINSFFAGCLKYDIYELAKKYNTANPNDLMVMQNIVEQMTYDEEVINYINVTLNTGNDSPNNTDTVVNVNPEYDDAFDDYNGLSFYFNNDVPFIDRIQPYDVHYNNYVNDEVKAVYNSLSKTETYPYPTSAAQTAEFFDKVIENNYNNLVLLFSQINYLLDFDETVSISFSLFGSASQPQTEDYNIKLGLRRIESVKKWVRSFNGGALVKYLENKRLVIKEEKSVGEGTDVTPKIFVDGGKPESLNKYDCTIGGNQIYTINAMACRATMIKDIIVKRENKPVVPEPVIPNPTNERVEVRTKRTITDTIEKNIETLPKNISKKILRMLMSECDYFEAIKEDTPLVFDNLKDKLKYFDPAFHSMTPEGLNSRLTFLNQCLRPGDTIPTIKENKLEYNNAKNTAFGAPPVLVLRIGDFYHTKIIPKSLGLTFEGLDLNPEGIGVQPMFANVTIGFSFIGGQGIKSAVDKLQNALSFNYYANTEVYDDRSDVTDDSLRVIDNEFYELLKQQTDQPAPPEPQQTINNNGTIGKRVSGDNSSGVMSYSYFMDSLIDSTQDYFTTVFNNIKSVTDYYNHGVMERFTVGRNYIVGYIKDNNQVNLFGKPDGYIDDFNSIFDNYIKDISSEDDLFIKEIKRKVKPKLLRVLKDNYKKFMTKHKNNYLTELSLYNQKIADAQTTYYKTLTKLNIILAGITDGSDGYKNNKGNIIFYDLSATTDTIRAEMRADSDILINDLNSYYDLYLNEGIVYSQYVPTFNLFSSEYFMESIWAQNCYMLLSNVIVDNKKYLEFKNVMLSNIIENIKDLNSGSSFDVEKFFDEYWVSTVKPAFINEDNLYKAKIELDEKNKFKQFLDYKPFNRNKNREYSYTLLEDLEIGGFDPDTVNHIKKLIDSLNYDNNVNKDKTNWNRDDVNLYITKVKLL